MSYAYMDLSLPFRPAKPRDNGLTMILDKGMSYGELQNLVGIAGDFIDLVKLGWGTSAVMSRELVQSKCQLLREHNIRVSPGGTLVELSYLQGVLDEMLDVFKEIGFSCVEVSNGTVPMPEDEKIGVIRKALAAGFQVISEVGSKVAEEDRRLDVIERISQSQCELAAGAWKVIVEARESGTVGIFDDSGHLQVDMVNRLVEQVDPKNLLFEAPLKHQQVDLILRLGNDVNLGNIAPQDVVPLETLRLGLRGDTMRHFHMASLCLRLELGASGALAASRRGDIIVIIDALRASSTIVTALANGMSAVKVVARADECVGEITAGERGGHKIAQLLLDNSPVQFNTGAYKGKQLTLTTSNGAECILAAASNPQSMVLIGALLNASAVADASLRLAKATKRNISLVIAGRNDQLALEDQIAASEIALAMRGLPIRGDIQLVTSKDFMLDFLSSESGKNLALLGKRDDIVFCAQRDRFNVVPIFRDGLLTPLNNGF